MVHEHPRVGKTIGNHRCPSVRPELCEELAGVDRLDSGIGGIRSFALGQEGRPAPMHRSTDLSTRTSLVAQKSASKKASISAGLLLSNPDRSYQATSIIPLRKVAELSLTDVLA